MRATATTMRPVFSPQDMEIRKHSTTSAWPSAVGLMALLTLVVVGHGCHGGGHEDDDDELVYRPAAAAPREAKSPEPVGFGAQ